MVSQSSPTLPIIDFSQKDLKISDNTSSSWVSTRREVLWAMEEYGCFEALYDKVSLEIHTGICDAMEELFDLPVEAKSRYTSDVIIYGYSAESPQAPIRESMAIKDPTILEETRSFTNLMWPQGNERFRDTMYSYSKTISELDQMVTKMVFEELGVEKYYESIVESTCYLLRMMKYRDPKMNESNVGCNPHFDMTFTTILHQNQVTGLEIQMKNNGDWIQVKPSSVSSFIVMAGYPFKAWSNGRIHPAMHRVIMQGNKVRYSAALFSYSTGVIQTPDELVDEEHPLTYKPFNHIDSVVYFSKNRGALPN